MDLKELQTAMETHKANIEARVKELVKENGDKATEQVTSLTKDLAELKTTLAAIQEQVKIAASREVPGLKGEEAKKFSFDRAVAGIMADHLHRKGMLPQNPWDYTDSGHEHEVMEAAMKIRTGIVAKGDTMIGGDGSLGGYLIPEEVTSEVIAMAIADMPIMDLGPNVIRGLVGDLPVPKLTGRPTGYWLGETEAPSKTNATFGQVWMRPKKAGAYTIQSNRLMYQSRGVADQIVRRELANALALTLQAGYIKGLGTEKQPKGLLSHSLSVCKELAGARFKIDDAAGMIQYLDALDEYKEGAGNSFGFLMRPEVRGGMKRERVLQYSTQAAGAGAPVLASNLLMSNAILEQQIGHKVRTTTLLAANETASGTTSATTSKVLFGNFGLFRIGLWRDFVLRASDVASDGTTNSMLQDCMMIVCFQETDCMIDREAGFCVDRGAEVTEANW